MLTAVVRDLHWTHPHEFLTDVRTSCPALWEHNPYITPLDEREPGVEIIDCDYPLVHDSNQRPYHFIHGFRIFLQQALQVDIIPHEFRGDIHLAAEERSWLSQVDEVTGRADSRFWIIVSGGKKDYTAKWWDPDRLQEVVDHFQGRLCFVQCGEKADYHVHPPLRGVIDLVGKTSLRELVRLMYHADGVICPVTLFMHLAAAVETKQTGARRPQNRPCVVVAGGREPSHWEAYPHHTFLHTNGCLPCCEDGGCWKSRVVPVGDGDGKDADLCVAPVALPSGRYLPQCLDLISAKDVIRAVERYLAYDEVGGSSVERHRSTLMASGNVNTKVFEDSMYSQGVQDHFEQPRRVGTFSDATAIGQSGIPGQGNFMVLYVRLSQDGERIHDVRFQTYGCPAAIACGSWVSEWTVGRTIEEAGELTAEAVRTGLGSLPLGREHCADLAVGALRDALKKLGPEGLGKEGAV